MTASEMGGINLMNTMILYQSKYGATKKYAQWLAEELQCDLLEIKAAKIAQLKEYDTIVIGGGVYASGIAGIQFLKKNYQILKGKKIVVFAVGASPFQQEAVEALKERNLGGELCSVPLFYCRGAWNEDVMSFTDRALCGMLKKAVVKKDPASYAPWEAALIESVGKNNDWTDPDNLRPIIKYINA